MAIDRKQARDRGKALSDTSSVARRSTINILKWIAALIAGVILVTGSLWFLSARHAYLVSLEGRNKPLKLSSYSPQMLLITKSAINGASARNQLARTAAHALKERGLIGYGMARWHLACAKLLSYITVSLSSDEVYEHLLSYGTYGRSADGTQAQYGISNTAKNLWQIEPASLSISQSALLMALNLSPSKYDPRKNVDKALQARNKIIEKAAGAGLISSEEAARATAEPLGVH